MSRPGLLVGALAALSLVACGGASGGSINQPNQPDPPNQPETPSATTIRIVNRAETRGTGAFSPNPLTIALAGGGEVHWFNDDREPAGGEYTGTGTTHSIVADDLSFNSGDLPPGAAFDHRFQAEGAYAYHCSLHPTMTGTVIVTP